MGRVGGEGGQGRWAACGAEQMASNTVVSDILVGSSRPDSANLFVVEPISLKEVDCSEILVLFVAGVPCGVAVIAIPSPANNGNERSCSTSASHLLFEVDHLIILFDNVVAVPPTPGP